MSSHSKEGLKRDRSRLDLVSLWTRQPSTEAIETVCRHHLQINNNANCIVSFHAQRAYSNLYLVRTNEQSLLMRISLPVCPQEKTRGEATTLRWLADITDGMSIPLPKLVAFDDTSQNEIGFEWILMKVMPGVTAWKKWRSLTLRQKVALTQDIAVFQAQLLVPKLPRANFPGALFSGIGTLGCASDGEDPLPGQLVSDMFVSGDHINDDGVQRGPFRSSHDWLKSCLELAMQRFEGVTTTNCGNEEEIEEAKDALQVTRRLLTLLPKIFPSIQEPPECTALIHYDLGLQDILLDERGRISCVLNWECVSPMPLWAATQWPKFLRSRDRREEPRREDYPDEADPPDEGSENGQRDADDLDNEGKSGLYWIHLMEYDATQLRLIYHDRRGGSGRSWDLLRKESTLKVDFYDAVVRCVHAVCLNKVQIWVDNIEAGDFVSLQSV